MWRHNVCSAVLFCKLIIYKVYKGSAKIWLNNFQNMNRYYVQRIKLHQKTISNLFISLYKTLLIQIIISRGLKMLGRASQENFSYFINCEWYLPFFLSPFLRFFLWKRNIPHFHYASSSIRLCRVLRKEISTCRRILDSIYFVYSFITLINKKIEIFEFYQSICNSKQHCLIIFNN